MFCCIECNNRLELSALAGREPRVMACSCCAQNYLIHFLPEGHLVRFLGNLLPLTTRLAPRTPFGRRRGTTLIVLDQGRTNAAVLPCAV